MENNISVLISEQELQQKVKELGAKITEDYKDTNLLLIGVLRGGVIFMSDLMRSIELPIEIDFMQVSSYGSGTVSSGNVKILKDTETSVEGRDVLIAEDILDTGTTLHSLVELIKQRGASSVKICTILNKPARRKVRLDAEYVGFNIPDKFVVGYGLDYDQKYRNLPFVGVIED